MVRPPKLKRWLGVRFKLQFLLGIDSRLEGQIVANTFPTYTSCMKLLFCFRSIFRIIPYGAGCFGAYFSSCLQCRTTVMINTLRLKQMAYTRFLNCYFTLRPHFWGGPQITYSFSKCNKDLFTKRVHVLMILNVRSTKVCRCNCSWERPESNRYGNFDNECQ